MSRGRHSDFTDHQDRLKASMSTSIYTSKPIWEVLLSNKRESNEPLGIHRRPQFLIDLEMDLIRSFIMARSANPYGLRSDIWLAMAKITSQPVDDKQQRHNRMLLGIPSLSSAVSITYFVHINVQFVFSVQF